MSGDDIPGVRLAALSVALAIWAGGCGGDTATPPSCSFALSPSSAFHAAAGGVGSVTVTVQGVCTWTASPDAVWVAVTSGSRGRGSGTVTYRVAPNTTTSARSASIRLVPVGDGSPASHRIYQAGTTSASAGPPVTGPYTFRIEADPDGACGWPVTTFAWPVAVEVASYTQGTTLGAVWFPPSPIALSNRWDIRAGPTGTQLTPGPGGPGRGATRYDLLVDGGHWEAGEPSPARDGRGVITGGTARGARLILEAAGSHRRWECQSDAKWSLLLRNWDSD